jgi:hypothetical protein
MHLTLVAPGLLALDAADLARARPLARFARFARVERNASGMAAATLAAVGLHDVPPAPLLALGAGLDGGGDCILAADPVTLVAGRDDVRLAGRVDDLDPATAAALVARLNAHFRDDGVTFVAPRPAHWFVRLDRPPALVTTAIDVASGHPVFPFLPTGADARTWRRWGDEIQMLLHATPEHATRAHAGALPVNGVWFWGGGTLGASPAAAVRSYAPADASGDLARGVALASHGDAHPLPSRFDAIARTGERSVVVLPRATADSLATLSGAWFAPALVALERGRLASLVLVADGAGVATWSATRPSVATRFMTAIRRARFVPPANNG